LSGDGPDVSRHLCHLELVLPEHVGWMNDQLEPVNKLHTLLRVIA
jgi:hypothetical protein